MMYSIIGIALLATTGIGYAAFTSTATANYNGSAGTLNLYFTSASVTGGTTYGTCSASVSGGQLYVSFTGGAPGDTCSFTSTIHNGGSLPATSLYLNYTMIQSYPNGAVPCDAYTGAGNCLWYPNDQIQGSSGPATGTNILAAGMTCSQANVGSTLATAAHCSVSSTQVSALGTMTIAAGGDGTYFGTITVIAGGFNCPGANCQLGAVQGMTASQTVSITGSVGA